MHENAARHNKQQTTKALHIGPIYVHQQCVFYTIQNPDCIGPPHVDVTYVLSRFKQLFLLLSLMQKSRARDGGGYAEGNWIYIYIYIPIRIYILYTYTNISKSCISYIPNTCCMNCFIVVVSYMCLNPNNAVPQM